MDLIDALSTRVVIADGAMGTLLRARGVLPETCLEELCASQPELITQVHVDYVAAGARLVRTHSFGANAVRLAPWGYEHRVSELNWLAARIAREATKGTGAMVAASVGPTGQGAKAGKMFEEQIGALLDGGAQCVIFETFTDVDELMVAIEAKQSLHHCPAVAMLARADAAAWARLRDAGADVVGVNCAGTPAEILAAFGDANLTETAAFPSAGLPDSTGHYGLTPATFAEGAGELIARGVRLIGGCCGTTPEHIAALAAQFGEPKEG
jgi:homocysteine S-methyltransferase